MFKWNIWVQFSFEMDESDGAYDNDQKNDQLGEQNHGEGEASKDSPSLGLKDKIKLFFKNITGELALCNK